MSAADPAGILERLKQSARYRHLCPDILARVAGWAALRHASEKSALKAAKRKLHQIYGAYVERTDFARIETRLDGLSRPGADLRAACLDILRGHASTEERLPILDGLYPALLRAAGQPRSILDLACGLNPFALPWMDLGPDVRYAACDIDGRLVGFANRFLAGLGRPPGVTCSDILHPDFHPEADLVFLFKSLPCLEQQEKGAGLRLLRRIRAGCVAASFPTRSLGGRAKGMERQYETILLQMGEGLNASVRKLAYPQETFYLLVYP